MHITKLHITFDSEALLLKHILNALCNGFLAMSTKVFVNYIHVPQLKWKQYKNPNRAAKIYSSIVLAINS